MGGFQLRVFPKFPTFYAKFMGICLKCSLPLQPFSTHFLKNPFPALTSALKLSIYSPLSGFLLFPLPPSHPAELFFSLTELLVTLELVAVMSVIRALIQSHKSL